ncbi:MAG: hypothetical protein ACKV2V_12285 [Blastocatellia bacterium]
MSVNWFIVEQQIDVDTDELKWLVYGNSLGAREMALVAKLSHDNAALIITAFLIDDQDYE